MHSKTSRALEGEQSPRCYSLVLCTHAGTVARLLHRVGASTRFPACARSPVWATATAMSASASAVWWMKANKLKLWNLGTTPLFHQPDPAQTASNCLDKATQDYLTNTSSLAVSASLDGRTRSHELISFSMQDKPQPARINPPVAIVSRWVQSCLHCNRLRTLHRVSKRQLLYRVRASVRLTGFSQAKLRLSTSVI